MKIVIQKDQLESALPESLRGPLPILTTTMLTAADSKLIGRTTNLDVYLTRYADVVTEFEPGSICVNSAKLAALVKSLPSGLVSLESDDKLSVSITAGSVKAKLLGVDPKEYPTGPRREGKVSTIDALNAPELIGGVIHASSVEADRPAINGIRFEGRDGKLITCATNGRQLTKIETDLDFEGGFTVPNFIAQRVVRMVGLVKVEWHENAVKFSNDKTSIEGMLIATNYPNWINLIPKDDPKFDVEINRSELLRAIGISRLGADEVQCAVVFSFTKNELLLKSNSSSVGSVEQCVKIKSKGDVKVAIDPKYIVPALEAITTDSIQFKIIDDFSPVQITSGKTLSIIAPLRLP